MQAIPENYSDLLTSKHCVALTTLMPDGQPQSTVIWIDYDGQYVWVNTMSEFQKARNLRARPQVSILVWVLDPFRSMEIRGRVVSESLDGAEEHLNRLSQRYTGQTPYFGNVLPLEDRQHQTPVDFKIEILKVTVA